MKSFWIVLIVFVGFVAITVMSVVGKYNTLVNKQESVEAEWAQVENVYQRRADLIPNLVNTVKGYASHEKGTLEAVINARASATQTKIDPSNMTQDQLNQFQQNQGGLSQALGKLMMIQEAYPELKANENFKELQAQLEGTENRIAVERRNFNIKAKDYNTYLRKFPTNIIAGMFSFDKYPYFQAEEGANNAPKVEF
jgi:LemA protein